MVNTTGSGRSAAYCPKCGAEGVTVGEQDVTNAYQCAEEACGYSWHVSGGYDSSQTPTEV